MLQSKNFSNIAFIFSLNFNSSSALRKRTYKFKNRSMPKCSFKFTLVYNRINLSLLIASI
ncbi:hypothetical protein CAMGR0001_2781 [Campylobacter gracilis RM3268]|uniref:Uncharacterized protein n=1 Tax=Campylobacter gracilis RM3268 TaxID=553220 RepID=C8PKZ1_9BACT|nr:hypothetical protein CAMGR0001_2781 [Campylobacter gracilis RM3268]